MVITLFVPCIASVLVIQKELGWKRMAAIWGGAIAIAFTTGTVVAFLGGLVG